MTDNCQGQFVLFFAFPFHKQCFDAYNNEMKDKVASVLFSTTNIYFIEIEINMTYSIIV